MDDVIPEEPEVFPSDGEKEHASPKPVPRDTLRLSKPLPGLDQVVAGRSDFFAELAQVVALEVQRLLRYTMLTYAQPRSLEAEQKAENDVSNGLNDILTHFAEYVDSAMQIVANVRGGNPLPPDVEAAVLAKQLDESVAHNQDLFKKMERQEEKTKQLNMMLKHMRVQFYKDLESQRDRFRTLISRHCPELQAQEMKDVLAELSVVKLFDANSYMDEDTALAVQHREQALQSEFEIEREALLSQIQVVTEMEAETRHKLKVALKRGEKLQASLQKLSESSGKAAEEIPPLDFSEDRETTKEREGMLEALRTGTSTPTSFTGAASQRNDLKTMMHKMSAVESARKKVLHEVIALNDLTQKQQVWLETLQQPHMKAEVGMLRMMTKELCEKAAKMEGALLHEDGPSTPEEKQEFDLKKFKEATGNEVRIANADRDWYKIENEKLKAQNEECQGQYLDVQAEVQNLMANMAQMGRELASEKAKVEQLKEIDAPKTQTLKHANTTLKILKMLKWDKKGAGGDGQDETDMKSLNPEVIDEAVSNLVQDEARRQTMDFESMKRQLEKAQSQAQEMSHQKTELEEQTQMLKVKKEEEVALLRKTLEEEKEKEVQAAKKAAMLSGKLWREKAQKSNKNLKVDDTFFDSTSHGQTSLLPKEDRSAKSITDASTDFEEDEAGTTTDDVRHSHDEDGDHHDRHKSRKRSGKHDKHAKHEKHDKHETHDKHEKQQDMLQMRSLNKDSPDPDESVFKKKSKTVNFGHTEEEGRSSKDQSCQTKLMVSNKEITAEPEVVDEECQADTAKGRKKQGPHNCDAVLEWKGKGGRGAQHSQAQDKEIESLREDNQRLQAQLEAHGVSVPQEVVERQAEREAKMRQNDSDGRGGSKNAGSAPRKRTSAVDMLMSHAAAEAGLDSDDDAEFDFDSLKPSEPPPKFFGSGSTFRKSTSKGPPGSSKSVVLDETVEKVDIRAPSKEAGGFAEGSVNVAEEIRLEKERLREATPSPSRASLPSTASLNAQQQEHKRLKNELRVEYEACMVRKLHEERARIYRAWPRVASAEPIDRSPAKRLGKKKTLEVELRDTASAVVVARTEALRRIDHARLLAYNNDALDYGGFNDARVEDLRDLLESQELFSHYECIGSLTRRLMACRGEFKRMRNRLAGALFECDRLRLELNLLTEASVKQNCDFAILFRRQSTWLARCVTLLDKTGSHVNVPQALLRDGFDKDTVLEVLRSELAAKGKGAGESGQSEVDSKLARRKDRVMGAILVQARAQMLDHQLRAFNMADSLFVFHKIQEDEPGTRPRGGLMDLVDVKSMMKDVESLPGAASQLRMRLRLRPDGGDKVFQESAPTLFTIMDKIEDREKEVLEHYHDSFDLDAGDGPPRRQFEETVSLAVKANKFIETAEYMLSEGECLAAKAPVDDSTDEEIEEKEHHDDDDLRIGVADTISASLRRMDKRFRDDDDSLPNTPGTGLRKGGLLGGKKLASLKGAVRNKMKQDRGANMLKAIVDMAKAKQALMESHSVVQEVEDAMNIARTMSMRVEETPRQKKTKEIASKLEKMDPAKAAQAVLNMGTEDRGLVMDAMGSAARIALLSALPAVITKIPTGKKKEMQRNYEGMTGKPMPETEEECVEQVREAIQVIEERAETDQQLESWGISENGPIEGTKQEGEEGAAQVNAAGEKKASPKKLKPPKSKSPDRRTKSPSEELEAEERQVTRGGVLVSLPATVSHGLWDHDDHIPDPGPSLGFFADVMHWAVEVPVMRTPALPEECKHPKVTAFCPRQQNLKVVGKNKRSAKRTSAILGEHQGSDEEGEEFGAQPKVSRRATGAPMLQHGKGEEDEGNRSGISGSEEASKVKARHAEMDDLTDERPSTPDRPVFEEAIEEKKLRAISKEDLENRQRPCKCPNCGHSIEGIKIEEDEGEDEAFGPQKAFGPAKAFGAQKSQKKTGMMSISAASKLKQKARKPKAKGDHASEDGLESPKSGSLGASLKKKKGAASAKAQADDESEESREQEPLQKSKRQANKMKIKPEQVDVDMSEAEDSSESPKVTTTRKKKAEKIRARSEAVPSDDAGSEDSEEEQHQQEAAPREKKVKKKAARAQVEASESEDEPSGEDNQDELPPRKKEKKVKEKKEKVPRAENEQSDVEESSKEESSEEERAPKKERKVRKIKEEAPKAEDARSDSKESTEEVLEPQPAPVKEKKPRKVASAPKQDAEEGQAESQAEGVDGNEPPRENEGATNASKEAKKSKPAGDPDEGDEEELEASESKASKRGSLGFRLAGKLIGKQAKEKKSKKRSEEGGESPSAAHRKNKKKKKTALHLLAQQSDDESDADAKKNKSGAKTDAEEELEILQLKYDTLKTSYKKLESSRRHDDDQEDEEHASKWRYSATAHNAALTMASTRSAGSHDDSPAHRGRSSRGSLNAFGKRQSQLSGRMSLLESGEADAQEMEAMSPRASIAGVSRASLAGESDHERRRQSLKKLLRGQKDDSADGGSTPNTPRTPKMASVVGSFSERKAKVHGSGSEKRFPRRQMQNGAEAQFEDAQVIYEPYEKPDTETRETQTDMPLSSNMKVAFTQTEILPVERFHETRRLKPNRKTVSLENGEPSVAVSVMALTKVARMKAFRRQCARKHAQGETLDASGDVEEGAIAGDEKEQSDPQPARRTLVQEPQGEQEDDAEPVEGVPAGDERRTSTRTVINSLPEVDENVLLDDDHADDGPKLDISQIEEEDHYNEVVDIAQQSDVQWNKIPEAIISWLKLNLLQKMQGEFYCLPWEISEIEWFPDLKLNKRKRVIKEFEEFITNVMGRVQPSKHEVRKTLRQTYRSKARENNRARSESPQGRWAERIDQAAPDLSIDMRQQRPSSARSPNKPAADLPVEEGGASNELAASAPPAMEVKKQSTETQAQATAPGRIQLTAFDQSPAGTFDARSEQILTLKRGKQLAREGWPTDGEHLSADLPDHPQLGRQSTLERRTRTRPDSAPPQGDQERGLQVTFGKAKTVSEVLGFELPQDFLGSTDQDPYCLGVAAKEGLQIKSKKEAGDVKRKLRGNSVSPDVRPEAEMDSSQPSPAMALEQTEAAEASGEELLDTSQKVQEKALLKMLRCFARREKYAFNRLQMATVLPLANSVEFMKALPSVVKPPENRNPWRGDPAKKRSNAPLIRHAAPPPAQPPEEYVGAVSWSYRKAEPQPAAEPEPELPPPAPPKEPWTQKKAEELIRSLVDPRENMASLIAEHGGHGRHGRLGFRPDDRRAVKAMGAKPEDPDPLKPPVPPKPPEPPDPVSKMGTSGGPIPIWTPGGGPPTNWTTVRPPQNPGNEVTLPSIHVPASPAKEKRSASYSRTPRDGPKLGGIG